MRVSHLSLSNFRNHEKSEVDFSPGLNILVGLNGQGKTNLVEAINYFAGLQSHRTTNDNALIQKGFTSSVIRMAVNINDRSVLLELQINEKSANKAQLNKNRVPPRELSRWFSSVIFSPEDLSLIKGDPAVRRKFLDTTYSLIYPGHRAVMSDYDRVIRQRNSLLRKNKSQGSTPGFLASLQIWDEQLIELGSMILFARRAAIELLKQPLVDHYKSLTTQSSVASLEIFETSSTESRIHPNVSRETLSNESGKTNVSRETHLNEAGQVDVSRETLKEDLKKAVEASRVTDLMRGMTLVGPHRDEILFNLNNMPVKSHASHGETWSFALSLKLAQAVIIREFSPAGDPVIILDDVFAELDSDRREKLLNMALSYEQIIVTSAVAEDIPEFQKWNAQKVSEGSVTGPADSTSPRSSFALSDQ